MRERLVRRIMSQFHRPRGLVGRLGGWEMALRSSNRKRNAWAVALMEVQPSDRVLEIGFGPGIAVREIARRATRGEVVGIDHSAVMPAQAARRNAAAIREGRVAPSLWPRSKTCPPLTAIRQDPGRQQRRIMGSARTPVEGTRRAVARRRPHRDRLATAVSGRDG
jgi:SAM-dependent methyltransferase